MSDRGEQSVLVQLRVSGTVPGMLWCPQWTSFFCTPGVAGDGQNSGRDRQC